MNQPQSAVTESRWATYERLCEARAAARRDHKAAEYLKDTAAGVIADYLLDGARIEEFQLDDYRQKKADADRLRSAWFDARDAVETFMGRPVMVR